MSDIIDIIYWNGKSNGRSLPINFFLDSEGSSKFSMKQYTILSLNNCDLTEIPDVLKYIKEIRLNNCPRLVTLPKNVPNLKVIIFNECPRIDYLPNTWIGLEEIAINNCDNIYVFPSTYTRLKTLTCTYSPITILPSLSFLHTLYLNHTAIDTLADEYPNLSDFYCMNTPILTTLPQYCPQLKTLVCQDVFQLRDIPTYPNLIKLKCSDCESIESIPLLPNLTQLDCNGLVLLQSISQCPKLNTIDCSNCPLLKKLPSPLPLLRSLICDRCPLITIIPSYPSLESLSCYQSGVLCLSESLYEKQNDDESYNSVPMCRIAVLGKLTYNQPVLNKSTYNKNDLLRSSKGCYSIEPDGKVCNFEDISDHDNREFLNQDPKNLIFMIQLGDGFYHAYGYTLDQILSDPKTSIIYECMRLEDGQPKLDLRGDGYVDWNNEQRKAYVKISLEFQVYVPGEELLGAIESGERVFLLSDPREIPLSYSYGVLQGDDIVSDSHCQNGSNKTVYKLSICKQEVHSESANVLGKRRSERLNRHNKMK